MSHFHDRLLQLLSRLMNLFINLPEGETETFIDEALKETGLFIDVDRVYLFLHDYEQQVTTNTHEWCGEGVMPHIGNLQAVPFEMLPGILEKQIRGETVCYPRVSDMPPAHPMREVFEAQGIQSVVMIPTIHGDQCLGFAGFDSVKKRRDFSGMEIGVLKILAELLTNAMVKRRNEQALKAKEEENLHYNERLEALFKNSTDAIVAFDEAHKVIDINDNFSELFGYALEEIKGADVDDIVDPGNAKSMSRTYTKTILGGEKVILEGTRYTRDGSPVTVMIKGIPVLVGSRFCGGYGIYADITERIRAEEALRESEKKYREILGTIGDGYLEFDIGGVVTLCNEAAIRMLGYTVDEFTGMSYRNFCGNPRLVRNAFNRVFRTGKTEDALVFEMITKDGAALYGEISLSPVWDKNGDLLGYRGIVRDVTERKRYEKQLTYLSLHDPLTGIYNRAYFENELRRLSDGRKYPVTILSIDLDGLKLVNDTIGHQQGDQLLIACADLLKKTVRGSDTVARVGGDEFVALLPGTDSRTAGDIIDRIHARLDTLNRKTQGRLPVSISLGMATAKDKHKTLQETFKEADDLMYRDKLHKGGSARSRIIASLMAALGEKDFISGGHARRLEKYCKRVGERAGLSEKELSDLVLLARVHDLGNVGIPDDILFQKGPLTADQWQILKQHPEKGYRIALSSTGLSGVADLILKHHERWDGTGYPLGIAGEEIPVECRILAIADAFDAMTNDRPYRSAITREEAVNELKKNAGTQFDPVLVDSFLLLLEGQGAGGTDKNG